MSRQRFALRLEANPGNDATDIPQARRVRRHTIVADGKPPIDGSSAKAFRGEASRWNPEELFIAALAQCHYLSFVHVATSQGIDILDYRCEATGVLDVDAEGYGQIVEVVLEPEVTVAAQHGAGLDAAHAKAHDLCFIARSVSCEVTVKPRTHA